MAETLHEVLERSHWNSMRRRNAVSYLIATFLLAIIVAIEIDNSSEEVFDFPILGKLEARFDQLMGRPKWYIYGLISSEKLAKRRELVAPFGLTIVAPGCLVGGPTFKRHQAYNYAISSGLSLPAKEALLSELPEN